MKIVMTFDGLQMEQSMDGEDIEVPRAELLMPTEMDNKYQRTLLNEWKH